LTLTPNICGSPRSGFGAASGADHPDRSGRRAAGGSVVCPPLRVLSLRCCGASTRVRRATCVMAAGPGCSPRGRGHGGTSLGHAGAPSSAEVTCKPRISRCPSPFTRVPPGHARFTTCRPRGPSGSHQRFKRAFTCGAISCPPRPDESRRIFRRMTARGEGEIRSRSAVSPGGRGDAPGGTGWCRSRFCRRWRPDCGCGIDMLRQPGG
jgi:hypothetical protein